MSWIIGLALGLARALLDKFFPPPKPKAADEKELSDVAIAADARAAFELRGNRDAPSVQQPDPFERND